MPGRVDGYRFSVNSDEKPFESHDGGRQYITGSDARQVAQLVYERKGGGTVIVTEHGHAVTASEDGPVYLGDIDPTTFEYDETTSSITDEPDEDRLEDLL